MTNPIAVTLDVRNFPSNGSDGYTNTTATDNQTYSYKYGGGTDGAGDVDEITGGGVGQITVTLSSDPRYIISDVAFSGDPATQLSWTPVTSTQALITDQDTADEDAYYSLTIRDNSAQCTFPCDPKISNKPQ